MILPRYFFPTTTAAALPVHTLVYPYWYLLNVFHAVFCSCKRARGSAARRNESCWRMSRSRSPTWCRSCSPTRTRTWCRGCSCPPCASEDRRRPRRRSTPPFSAYRWAFSFFKLSFLFFCITVLSPIFFALLFSHSISWRQI